MSNLLLPTGSLLAERILLTPRVGAMLAGGGAAVLLLGRLGRSGGHVGSFATAVVAVLVLVGGARSVVRTRDWLDDDTIVPWTEIDAPRSYKARWDHARMLLRTEQPAAGAAEYRKALELFPQDARVLSEYADLRRLDGACGDAIPLYREAVRIAPSAWVSRTELALCLAATGDLVGTRAQAAELTNWPEADAARVRTQIESMARRPAVPVSPGASNPPYRSSSPSPSPPRVGRPRTFLPRVASVWYPPLEQRLTDCRHSPTELYPCGLVSRDLPPSIASLR